MESTKHAVEVAEAEGDLPRGLTAEDLMEHGDWVASGLPWIDPQKESVADDVALKNRTTSRQRIANRRGEDWYDLADEQIEEEQYLQAGGLSPFSEANAERTNALLKGEPDDDQDANPGTVGEETTRPVTG
jgi:capsid protein